MWRAARNAGIAVLGLMVPASLALAPASGADAATTGDWPAYLNGPAHSSYNASETAITPANAASLASRWRFLGIKPTQPRQPNRGFLASPTVVGGAVYIGADTGWFYKLDALF